MKPFFFFAFFPLLLISSCQQRGSVTGNKFADTVFVRIKDFQDRRIADSLVTFFASPNKAYRKDAALAFASLQDSMRVNALGKLLLEDPAWEVRQAAAFALGQTPGIESQTPLRTALQREKNGEVITEILESYGKVATPQYADDLLSNHSPDALAWSCYRAALKGKSNPSMNAKVSSFLRPEVAESARLGAAHYFARGATDFESLQQVILSAALRDTSAYVRMAAASALGKIKTDSSRLAAQKILQNDKDYRVRISAVRALQTFPFQQTRSFMFEALRDENINVAVAASETIKVSATTPFGEELTKLAREASSWRVRANLYEATLKVSANRTLVQEIMEVYRRSNDPYQKASLLIALQPSLTSYSFVQEQLFNADQPVIVSSAISSLVAMNYNTSFTPELKKVFAALYIRAIGTGDPAVIGIITGALTDDALQYKEVIKDYSFLHAAREKLSLPKENEAIQPLENAIAYFEGHPMGQAVVNTFNHPIDWPLVKSISRDLHADVRTTKGNILIRLLVEEAPGSVANFVALVKQHYFDNRFFHRVVPNFVVQTGCNRGDGWGSEDYSIRSEFTNRRYTTGSVGMASAGKDTEGTQWFITHSPTPHLDGRYTIFAEVESGMEVVHRLEVGDKILNIELK